MSSNAAEIIITLKTFAAERNYKRGDQIVGYGYAENFAAPLTRDAIDATFPNNPLYLFHVSMHGVVQNSKALQKCKTSAAKPTPGGGIIPRKEGSQASSGLLWRPLPFRC
ncbi:amidohydrolase family protein [Sphingorhabdus sp.]|uniref:amidohydrolase family protein n=1 Tax=Sphingorhabdus sp. TaxID=1902408 RepID=UPI0039830D1B